ncbi:dromaiocalcin-1-like [Symphorus nematophorus]
MQRNGHWDDKDGNIPMPFYCFNITSVGVKRTWEGAMKHCRDHQTHLISLLSRESHLRAQRVFQRADITERVWIGLRYLVDRWLWVKGDSQGYKAWPQGGDQDHQCPIRKRCGAISKEGLVWENCDCQDKLNFICE